MKNSKGKFYITTAIAYASSKPHFGNTYEIILADAYARFKRLSGYDVYLLTGTDEHGIKIEEKAEKQGVTPKEYVDAVSGQIKGIWDQMGATYDRFIRTTDADHEKAVSAIFRTLYEKGDIYKGKYEGWYCTPDESFFTDSQIKEEGVCPDCGRPLVRASEEAYFFRMSKYAPQLIKYIEDNPGFIEPESRKKEMVNNFLNAGLQDLCVSRTSFKWGIPVSFDDAHVIYVWIDALANYITALGYNPDNGEQPELFRKNWPADVHIIGKDILRFHTIYWPIILMALGLPLPKKVFGHPWFISGSDKMSKSKGNVVYADELAELVGVDGVRYYALSEMPYNADGIITYQNFITRYNNDLANTYGNLVSRTLSMNEKYFGGAIPERGEISDLDRELISLAETKADEAVKLADSLHISDALDAVFEIFRRANKYIDETTPWILAKSEDTKERLGSVIYNLLEAIRIGTVLLLPFIPTSAEKVLKALSCECGDFDCLKDGGLKPGAGTSQVGTLFPRIDEEEFLKKVSDEDKKQETKPAADLPPFAGQIDFSDFEKMDLRCGKILECDKIEKSKKLLKLKVDLGLETRQIVSGIAAFYQPADLIGRKVAVVANLKPAKLCGELSEGMILASGEKEIRVLFLDDAVQPGEKIR